MEISLVGTLVFSGTRLCICWKCCHYHWEVGAISFEWNRKNSAFWKQLMISLETYEENITWETKSVVIEEILIQNRQERKNDMIDRILVMQWLAIWMSCRFGYKEENVLFTRKLDLKQWTAVNMWRLVR